MSNCATCDAAGPFGIYHPGCPRVRDALRVSVVFLFPSFGDGR